MRRPWWFGQVLSGLRPNSLSPGLGLGGSSVPRAPFSPRERIHSPSGPHSVATSTLSTVAGIGSLEKGTARHDLLKNASVNAPVEVRVGACVLDNVLVQKWLDAFDRQWGR